MLGVGLAGLLHCCIGTCWGGCWGSCSLRDWRLHDVHCCADSRRAAPCGAALGRLGDVVECQAAAVLALLVARSCAVRSATSSDHVASFATMAA